MEMKLYSVAGKSSNQFYGHWALLPKDTVCAGSPQFLEGAGQLRRHIFLCLNCGVYADKNIVAAEQVVAHEQL